MMSDPVYASVGGNSMAGLIVTIDYRKSLGELQSNVLPGLLLPSKTRYLTIDHRHHRRAVSRAGNFVGRQGVV
jgi:hypothetical protein